MTPSRLHDPPRPCFASQTVCIEPPPALHERLQGLDPDLCERIAEQAARAVARVELAAALPASWRG